MLQIEFLLKASSFLQHKKWKINWMKNDEHKWLGLEQYVFVLVFFNKLDFYSDHNKAQSI